VFTADINNKQEAIKAPLKNYRIQLIALGNQYLALYPLNHFILAIETSDKKLLASLILSSWDLPISIFPIAPELPLAYKKNLLKQTGTRLIISDSPKTWEGRHTNIVVLAFEKFIWQCSTENKSIEHFENPIKLLVATSGTTNKPKAVCLSKANIIAHVQASQKRIKLGEQDTWLNCLPLNHVGGIMILFRTHIAGAGVIIQDGFEPLQIWTLVQKGMVSHLSLVPVMLEKLLHIAKNQNPPLSLKAVLIGGSALGEKLYKKAIATGWPLCVSYGSSETCSHIATHCDAEPDYSEGLTGKPLDGAEIAIHKPDSLTGQGLIKIKGPMLMSGYARADYILGEGLSNGWFTTNDLGCINKKGQLQVVGRADNIINTGSELVHPHLLESQLTQSFGIDEAVIVGIKDKTWGEKIALIYCGTWSIEQVTQWCDQHLKKQFKPRYILKRKNLPRNNLGKVQRNKLYELFQF